jgi:hypothetical protein
MAAPHKIIGVPAYGINPAAPIDLSHPEAHVPEIDKVQIAGPGTDLADIPTKYGGVVAANVVNIRPEFVEAFPAYAVGQSVLVAE